jgi:hypothetical protein
MGKQHVTNVEVSAELVATLMAQLQETRAALEVAATALKSYVLPPNPTNGDLVHQLIYSMPTPEEDQKGHWAAWQKIRAIADESLRGAHIAGASDAGGYYCPSGKPVGAGGGDDISGVAGGRGTAGDGFTNYTSKSPK